MAAKKQPAKRPTKKKRHEPDWETIEREYRAGQISVNEIARQHGVTPQAVRMRAKRCDWSRDLSGQVRERVRAELVADAVTPSVTPPNAREVIDAAGLRGAEVVRAHRRDISRARSRTDRIGSQVERLLERIEGMQPDDDNFLGYTNAAASANNALSQAMARLVPLERQAFSLDDPSQGDNATALSSEQIRRMAQEVASQE